MNKYLLLRDNKQSGPYTVDEIIVKGIKAYDLVWLEGKSAAWRYPGEIEELKAYSPNTEEQPFDRFYKKPETTTDNNSRFEPKTVVAETSTVSIPPSKKVYINFPGTQKKIKEPEQVITAVSFAEPEKMQEPVVKYTDEPVVNIKESIVNTKKPVIKNNDNRLLYAGIAACFVLVSFILYFAISYTSQKKDINQLSALLQQLEERAKKENTIINPAVTAASGPLVEDVSPVQESIADRHDDVIPTKKHPNPAKPIEKTIQPAASAIVQTVTEPSQKNNIIAPATHENLFQLVSVKSNKYKTGVLGGISNLELELTNNSPVPLHRVAVEIKYLGPEKRVIKTQTVYFENISPGSQSVLAVPKSNRGITVDYVITDIRS